MQARDDVTHSVKGDMAENRYPRISWRDGDYHLGEGCWHPAPTVAGGATQARATLREVIDAWAGYGILNLDVDENTRYHLSTEDEGAGIQYAITGSKRAVARGRLGLFAFLHEVIPERAQPVELDF